MTASWEWFSGQWARMAVLQHQVLPVGWDVLFVFHGVRAPEHEAYAARPFRQLVDQVRSEIAPDT